MENMVKFQTRRVEKSLSLCGKQGLFVLSKILSNVLKMGQNRAKRPEILYFFHGLQQGQIGFKSARYSVDLNGFGENFLRCAAKSSSDRFRQIPEQCP